MPARGSRSVMEEHKGPQYLLFASQWTAKRPRTLLGDKRTPELCCRWCWEAQDTSPAAWVGVQAVGTLDCGEQGCDSDLEVKVGLWFLVAVEETQRADWREAKAVHYCFNVSPFPQSCPLTMGKGEGALPSTDHTAWVITEGLLRSHGFLTTLPFYKFTWMYSIECLPIVGDPARHW